MIFYNPTENDVLTSWIRYNPKSTFIMTQLGGIKSIDVVAIMDQLSIQLAARNIQQLDANSLVTGRDFQSKIWKLALSVPIGIAVVSETMPQSTIANVFYELGLMNALGKETLVIKTQDFIIPSDFIRTEYIEYDDSFENRFTNFLNQVLDQAEYYRILADNLIAKPLLSIDYLRRAYLITGENSHRQRAIQIIDENEFDEHLLLMIRSYFNIQN